MLYQNRSHSFWLVTAHVFRSARVGAGKSAWVRDSPWNRAWAGLLHFMHSKTNSQSMSLKATLEHLVMIFIQMITCHDMTNYISCFSHHSTTGPGTSFPAMPTSCSLGFRVASLATKGSAVAQVQIANMFPLLPLN